MKKKTTIKKRLTKRQVEANKIQKELEIVCSWTTVSSDKTLRIYALNRKIFNDNHNYCTKCPGAIRNVFNKLKKYYNETKKNN